MNIRRYIGAARLHAYLQTRSTFSLWQARIFADFCDLLPLRQLQQLVSSKTFIIAATALNLIIKYCNAVWLSD